MMREMDSYELVIIGAGAAGLAAGIYAARSGLKTVILDEKIAGGTTADAPLVENYPSYPQISGFELADKMAQHCRKTGVPIHELESVTELSLQSEKKIVTTNADVYLTSSVLLATGSEYREINVPGEKEFRGRGVSYCGVCDGPLFKGKRVLVVGGGNSALTTAVYLSGIVDEVIIVHRRELFRAEDALVKDALSKKNVRVLWNVEVKEIVGEKLVNKVVLLDNRVGELKELDVEGVFVQIGESPNSQVAKASGVEVDENGYIKIDLNQRTNIPGVCAAGDVTNHPVKQVGTAVGQGITAALETYAFVRQPYCRK
jgi:thioredoxin reductase (NADPH)